MILLHRLVEAVRFGGGRANVADLALAIGTKAAPDGSVGRRSPLGRAVDRLVRFRLAIWSANGGLAVVLHVPALSERDLARLPERFRELHRRFVAEALKPPA